MCPARTLPVETQGRTARRRITASSSAGPEVRNHGKAELQRVGERVHEGSGQREVRVRRRGREQDHENSQSLEEQSECLHSGGREVTRVLPRAPQYEVESMDTDPKDRGERPRGNAPADDQEQRQCEEDDEGSRQRRQEVTRLRSRRAEKA